jgi:DNA-binding beta-propeller fold protein YncE
VIDAASNDVRLVIPVGPKPNGLAWDPNRKHLLVADVQDYRARLVEPATGRLIASAPLPGRPRWCGYDQSGDRLLVNIREPACVAVLRAESLEPEPPLPLPVAGPHGLDIDQVGHRLFVACDGGEVVVLDRATGQQQSRVPIAGEPDAIWFNERRQRLYVAIGNPGVVDVIDGMTPGVVEQIDTEAGAHTTAFDPLRQRLYVFLPRRCAAAVYEEI